MIVCALRFLLVVAAAALVWASPSAAQQRTTPGEVAAIEAEMTAYGAWLGRVQEIEAPLQRELAGLSASYRQGTADGERAAAADQFRATINRILALADSTNALLEALDQPEVSALELPEDISPAAIVRDMAQLNRRIRDLIDGFNPLIDARLRGDSAALEAAANQLFAGLGQLFDSQILLARASLAATPHEDASWEVANFDLLFLRAGARIVAAFQPRSRARVDAALTGDLLALAEEIDANSRRGETRVEAELADLAATIADAEADGDTGSVAILRRVAAMFSELRGYFPLSRELAALLRAEAPAYRARALAQADFTRIFAQIQTIRNRMEAIGTRAAAIMAGAQ